MGLLGMTDLIKLNEKGVRAYKASGGAICRPKQREWRNRIGKVAKYSRDRSLAYVIWDGTRSFDRVPIYLIEPAAGSQGR
jgi:hypothetical protein